MAANRASKAFQWIKHTPPPLRDIPREHKLRLYKALLRGAAVYPSIKREGIISDVKSSFRKNAVLTDELMVNHHFEAGCRVLREFNRYTGYQDTSNFTIN